MQILLLTLIFYLIILPDQAKAENAFTILSNWSPEKTEWQTLESYEKLLRKNLPKDRFLVFGPSTIPTEHQFKMSTLGIFDFLFTQAHSIPDKEKAAYLLEIWPHSSAELRETAFWQALEGHYNSKGLKILSAISSGNGYHLLLRDKPNFCSLEGAKISVPPPFDDFIEQLAGIPIKRNRTITPEDLKNDKLDGFFAPIKEHSSLSWSKTVRFRTQPIGNINHLIFINLKKWNSLNEDDQQKIYTASIALEAKIFALRKRKAGGFFADLQKKNIESIDFCESQTGLLNYAFAKSLMELSSVRPSLLTDQLKQLIRIPHSKQ
tara:strand:+ start:159 stop:1121 length:963 start_codon:yes stop_codon:yes gene_type:complete